METNSKQIKEMIGEKKYEEEMKILGLVVEEEKEKGQF